MLLSSTNDNIPYKPFPVPYEKNLLNDELISGIVSDEYTGTIPLDGFEEIELPKNHCTILLGISDEYFEDYVNFVRSEEWAAQINPYELIIGTFELGPISYVYDVVPTYESVLSFRNVIPDDEWTPTYTEIYVQIDFKNKANNYYIYPKISLAPIYFNFKVSENKTITAYPRFYIKMSNEIHEHGPDITITIDNSKSIQ